MQRLDFPTVLRFCVSGLLTALIYYAVARLAVLAWAWPAALAGFVAYACCMPVGYFLHRRLTFASTQPAGPQVARFMISSTFGSALATLLPSLLTSGGLSLELSLLLTCVSVPVLSFLLLSAWVFGRIPQHG